MTTVNIGVGHNDNLVIAQAIDIEGFTNTDTKGLNHSHNFFVSEHFIKTSALSVENFTTKRQNCLRTVVATLFS
ncbi:hypothetical protein D9M69_568110 [compost metagenome]